LVVGPIRHQGYRAGRRTGPG